MTEHTTTTPTTLFLLRPGDVFFHQSIRYVVIEHMRSRTKIARISDRKQFVLSMSARVLPDGHDSETFAAVLEGNAERRAARGQTLDLKVGQKVRIVDDSRTRKAGIAGVVTTIVRVNQKTYGLANDYRVGPSFVEAI